MQTKPTLRQHQSHQDPGTKGQKSGRSVHTDKEPEQHTARRGINWDFGSEAALLTCCAQRSSDVITQEAGGSRSNNVLPRRVTHQITTIPPYEHPSGKLWGNTGEMSLGVIRSLTLDHSARSQRHSGQTKGTVRRARASRASLTKGHERIV